jgi:RimJ/RimL family protein N-acetyltransferase
VPLDLPIELGAITLRPFEPDDFEQFCAYWCLPEVARYVPWSPDPDAAREALIMRSDDYTVEVPGDRMRLAIVVADVVVGEVMLAWAADEHRQGEVGFALRPDHHGRGIARAAATEMLRIGFDDLGLHRIVGRCDPRNGPSATLLTRLGMRPEAHLRESEFFKGEWADTLVFAILDREWQTSPA